MNDFHVNSLDLLSPQTTGTPGFCFGCGLVSRCKVCGLRGSFGSHSPLGSQDREEHWSMQGRLWWMSGWELPTRDIYIWEDTHARRAGSLHGDDTMNICCQRSKTFLFEMTKQGHRKFVSSLSWEPAHVELPSRRFCSGSKDNTIKIWEASTR